MKPNQQIEVKDVTPELIENWKSQYESVWKLLVGDKTAYVRNPNRKELSYATQIGAKDPIKFNEYLLKNCWLVGDMEIQTKDSLFMSAGAQLHHLIEVQEAKLEKL